MDDSLRFQEPWFQPLGTSMEDTSLLFVQLRLFDLIVVGFLFHN